MWFTPDRSAVHDLVLGNSVVFMVNTRAGAGCLTFDYVNLHVLDLNPHQQEIDFSHNYIFQMVPVKNQNGIELCECWDALHHSW